MKMAIQHIALDHSDELYCVIGFGSFFQNKLIFDDIDILFVVDSNKKFSMFQYLKLNQYLETNLQSKVDLVREATLKDIIKPYVQKDLIYV